MRKSNCCVGVGFEKASGKLMQEMIQLLSRVVCLCVLFMCLLANLIPLPILCSSNAEQQCDEGQNMIKYSLATKISFGIQERCFI